LACLIRHQDFIAVNEIDPSCYLVFKLLMDDLTMLSVDGVVVHVIGKPVTFLGTLATVSADNLSAHTLAGFQKHFNCGRIRRLCMIDHTDISLCYDESNATIRTDEIHKYNLEAVDENQINCSIYGVLHASVFLRLGYFQISDGFPPYIMHDLLEGVILQTIKIVLSAVINHGRCSLDDLNRKMKVASLKVSKKPCLLKPPMLKDSGSIVGSASLEWSLFLLLLQLVGQYASCDDTFWQVYLLLHDITDLVFSPSVRKSYHYLLEGLVRSFLSSYCETFGASSLTPKFHCMIHYSRLMSVFGPLKHLWGMCFESKHQNFKTVIASLHNYINVTSTMAQRHRCVSLSNLVGLNYVVGKCIA
jgi:hypothetical protein